MLAVKRHDLRRKQNYLWQHDLCKKGLCEPVGAALFLPFDLAPASVPEAKVAAVSTAPMVEIVLRTGRQIRCRGGIWDDDLAHSMPSGGSIYCISSQPAWMLDRSEC
jgi:hypothetical protein